MLVADSFETRKLAEEVLFRQFTRTIQEEIVHEPLHEIIEQFDEDLDGSFDSIEFAAYYDTFFGLNESHNEPEPHGHQHKKTIISKRTLLATQNETEHDHSNETTCPLPDILFSEHDLNNDTRLNETEIAAVTIEMVLVQKIQACSFPTDSGLTCPPVNVNHAWGWSILSAVIVSIVGLIGAVLIPLKSPQKAEPIMNALLGLSVGALLGDAILHLIPHAFEHDESLPEVEAHSHQLKLGLVLLASLAAFYIIEKLFHYFIEKKKKQTKEIDMSETESTDTSSGDKPKKFKDIKAFGWLNLISDGVHNFTDGIALGVAFLTSPSVGLSTAIAVVLHEVPQELGDYALLIRAGFTKKQALLFNLLSASICIVGAIVGVAIGSSGKTATPWILAFVAGTFLYIALADIVPELQHDSGVSCSVLQIGGILLGITLMALLVLFESSIEGKKC